MYVCLVQFRTFNYDSNVKWTPNIPELDDLAAQFFYVRLLPVSFSDLLLYWVMGVGYWVLGIGYWVLGIGY